MSSRLRGLQSGVLRIILLFLWLAVVLFIIGLLGNIFNLTVMNNELWTIFGIILGILVVLGFLHVVISLNIISNVIAAYSGYSEPEYRKLDYKKIFTVSGILIVLVLGIQFTVKVQVEKKNLEVLKQQAADIGSSAITAKIVTQIDEDARMRDLYFSRDLLLLTMKENSLTLLIPKIRDGNKVFYQVTPWDYDSRDERKISEALERPYIPDKSVKEKFDKMLKDRKSFEIKSGGNMTIFYPV
ncbi:MAG: hypothetical protein LBV03_08125, partial [Fusobacteriales bacterium]|nr:hypothetical protein [Fusobacteriales bacterium]